MKIEDEQFEYSTPLKKKSRKRHRQSVSEGCDKEREINKEFSPTTKPNKSKSQSTETGQLSETVPLGDDTSASPPLPSTPDSASDEFTLNEMANLLCLDPPDFMDVRDDQLAMAFLGDIERGMMDDMIAFFVKRENVKADEKSVWGPPKWLYDESDYFDCFDFYASNGCPNCGNNYKLDSHEGFHFDPPALVCHGCGHRAAPMHFSEESDSQVDVWRDAHRVSVNQKTDCVDELSLYKEEALKYVNKHMRSSDSSLSSAVYVRGVRRQHNFGQQCKSWWQSQFLPRSERANELHKTMMMISYMASLKAATIDEHCDICGNDKAYFHTYQARSADEGMTIMYECTRCHSRRTFNN